MYIIVEDDPSVADALESLLSGAGLPVRVFASAEELIHSAPPTPEDTMIVDLGLPGMSGGELVRHLEKAGATPRVIAISGKSSRTIARETEGLAAVKILRKPPAADWLEAITA
ncbi:response regulator [Pleomorphomonas sp. JP5]|uniref:response regulator n=1 Tax=Pleomorphomonas sp. JP5 TaxID=2942998 RepID=UPI002043088E|nr:response regulator [Pleomorphomonas sp. JP5]MCM5558194.1 response regulator [Pleomorphomonas sp. JP5]